MLKKMLKKMMWIALPLASPAQASAGPGPVLRTRARLVAERSGALV